MKIIYNNSCKELGEKIASKKNAVPAGGTASALNGYLGVSLLLLVVEVSKNNFDKSKRNKIKTSLEKAKDKFLKLMEKDIKAYNINSNSNFNNKEKLKELINTPLEIEETATNIFKYNK